MDSQSQNDRRLELARDLVAALEEDRQEDAEACLEGLFEPERTPLFREVGRITREVHDALMDFANDSRLTRLAEAEMPDARERLRYVISLTDQAANRTLALVEDSMPVADRLIERSRRLTERLAHVVQKNDEQPELRKIVDPVNTYLDSIQKDGNRLRTQLTEVMMAQEFQDLSGQMLMRVTEVLEQLEEKLVRLVRLTSLRDDGEDQPDVEHGQEADKDRSPSMRGHGPQIPGQADDVVKNQDDVDDLLASLGF
ncbi:MAG: protein phosphatase CheZ [Halothiobacillaceae bacterium]